MNRANVNEVLSDIIHTASQAILCEDESVARQALGDIASSVASVIPVEIIRRDRPKAKINHIFARDIETICVKIPGHKITGTVEKDEDGEFNGYVFDNGDELFQIWGMGRGKSFVGRVTKFAMKGAASRLGHHRRLKENKRRAGILTPEAELAETVARQKEMDEPQTVGCPAFRLMTHLPSGFDGVEPTDEDLENA